MEINIKLQVSDQLCADVLCTAYESNAIGYWAAAIQPRYGKDKDGNPEYVGLRIRADEGGDLELHDIGYPSVALGIQRILDGSVKVGDSIRADILKAVLDDYAGDIDVERADCIIQASMFNYIVFW